MLPVAQMAPPTITRGQNFGLFRMMFTTKETVHIAAHKIHWKNIPAQYGEQKINENLPFRCLDIGMHQRAMCTLSSLTD